MCMSLRSALVKPWSAVGDDVSHGRVIGRSRNCGAAKLDYNAHAGAPCVTKCTSAQVYHRHMSLSCRRPGKNAQADELARRVTLVASSMASLSPTDVRSPGTGPQLDGTADVLHECRRQQLLQCKNEQLQRQVDLLQSELAVQSRTGFVSVRQAAANVLVARAPCKLKWMVTKLCMQATHEIPLTCERVLRTLHTDLGGICGSASMEESDASSLSAAQISAVRKRCGESLTMVRGALKRATRAEASGARPQAVPSALRMPHSSGKPAWVRTCDEEHDSTPRTPWASEIEAEPLQRSHTFAASHTSPSTFATAGDVPRASPLRGTHSAGQVSRARKSPSSCARADSGSALPEQADPQQRTGGAGGLNCCEWREAEALLAELPGRLANVAVVLKVHVWPAMTAMPIASKEGWQVGTLYAMPSVQQCSRQSRHAVLS